MQVLNIINRIKKIPNEKLEGVGLILLFVAFGWQLLEIDLTNWGKAYDSYIMDDKISKIYQFTSEIYYSEILPDDAEKYDVHISNLDYINKEWELWDNLKREKQEILNKLESIIFIRLFIYTLGSALLIIPKFRKPIK